MKKLIFSCILVTTISYGMDKKDLAHLKDLVMTEHPYNLALIQDEFVEIHPWRMFLYAGIFIGSFSHLFARAQAGMLGLDRQLIAELTGSYFLIPMAEEYGRVIERAAGTLQRNF